VIPPNARGRGAPATPRRGSAKPLARGSTPPPVLQSRAMVRLVPLVLATALTTACFDPEDVTSVDTEVTSGDDTTTSASATVDPSEPTSTTVSTTVDPDTGTGTTDPDTTGGPACTADQALDDACSGSTPYCRDGECVGCDALDNGVCAEIDAATPACDAASGLCSQCTETSLEACEPQQVCVDAACSPCTANAQCASMVCQDDIGECLLTEVHVQGLAVFYDQIETTPAEGVEITVTNVDPVVTAGPTGKDGAYELVDIPPGTLLDFEMGLEQDEPVFVPASMHTRSQLRVENDTPVLYDAPIVTYAHLAQVAFECGLFPTLEAAIGNGAVNVYFAQRSTVFGRLVDDMGNGVPTVSRAALQVEVDGYVNIHDNLLDNNPNPAHVCFLDEDDSGHWVGTTATSSNDTGRFVMFRVRDANGTGQGGATVRASGFDDAQVNLRSTGNIGVVELVRNDEAIPRDFAIDVYPIFTTYACVGCHTGGGPPSAVTAGFNADWDLPPMQVWQNLVGPGTTCPDPMNPVRVCTDDPENSLFVTNPLFDEIGMEDVHPVDIFPSLDDPAMRVIVEWIEQGAQPPTAYNFTEDVYPLFTLYGCVGCHTGGGPPEAVTAGFQADWSLAPMDVWENLVGPGTVCPDLDNPLRVCTNAPASSLLVTYPLVDDVGMPDPHPLKAFPNLSDPDLQIILQWIAQGALFEVTCEHDPCEQGGLLNPGCSPCVQAVCAMDPYCCNTAGDGQCVNEAAAFPACGC
jgi:hypothetical protein